MDDSDPDPDAKAAREIDENLRRVFKEMEEARLPDRFADLLSQLREKDKDKGDQG